MKSISKIPKFGGKKNITFHKCYGKLANRWIDYRIYQPGELYFYKGGLHQKTGSAGAVSQPSTTSSFTNLNLTRVGGGTGINVNVITTTYKAVDGNPVIRK